MVADVQVLAYVIKLVVVIRMCNNRGRAALYSPEKKQSLQPQITRGTLQWNY